MGSGRYFASDVLLYQIYLAKETERKRCPIFQRNAHWFITIDYSGYPGTSTQIRLLCSPAPAKQELERAMFCHQLFRDACLLLADVLRVSHAGKRPGVKLPLPLNDLGQKKRGGILFLRSTNRLSRSTRRERRGADLAR